MATGTALKLRFDACFWQDDQTGLIIAEARPLDVVSAGRDEAEAGRNLDEALQAFLEATREMGTLDVILEEAGYRMVEGIWEPPAVTSSRADSSVSRLKTDPKYSTRFRTMTPLS